MKHNLKSSAQTRTGLVNLSSQSASVRASKQVYPEVHKYLIRAAEKASADVEDMAATAVASTSPSYSQGVLLVRYCHTNFKGTQLHLFCVICHSCLHQFMGTRVCVCVPSRKVAFQFLFVQKRAARYGSYCFAIVRQPVLQAHISIQA